MAKLYERLTARSVVTLRKPGLHADGGGLYLEVDQEGAPKEEGGKAPIGAKRWVFLFQWKAKRRQMGLGSARLVSLAEARGAALAARKLVAEGVNPIDLRRKPKMNVATFGDIAGEVLKSVEDSAPNAKHFSQWKTSLEVYAAPIRSKPPGEITTEDVLDILKPLWIKIPETASRTRGRIERVLDAAKAKGLRSGENPARWKGHLSLLLPKRQKLTQGHHPALPYADIAIFMADLRSRDAISARALELTILAATRTRETLGARWGEMDLVKAIWTIPAERMKMKVEHRVPLSKDAIGMLRRMRALQLELWPARDMPSALVFPSVNRDDVLSNMAMEMLLRRMKFADVSVHGFRSTFRDWCGEETDHPRELVEAALAHTIGSEVERAYRRGDALERRRIVMQDWADFCSKLTDSTALTPSLMSLEAASLDQPRV